MRGNPEIRSWYGGEIIVPAGKYPSLKIAVAKEKQNLQKANLRGVDLRSVDLQGANLYKADLYGSNLRGVNLRKANLRNVSLREANLRGAYLYGANLRDANLCDANLQRADLQKANLQGADLWRANLYDAKLQGANLQGTSLQGANLQGANLRKATLHNVDLQESDLRKANLQETDLRDNNFSFLPDLYSLKLLPPNTTLRYWKYLIDGVSPYRSCTYKVGKIYKFKDYDKDERITCSKGGNVATLMWCLQDCLYANEFIEVEFKVKDIAAIPFATDGKFRVKKFKVIRKINRKQALKLLRKVMKGV